MKLGNRQMEVVEHCIHRRIRAKHQAVFAEKRKAYDAMVEAEKAAFTADVQKKHVKVFAKLDAIKAQLKELDEQKKKLQREMEDICIPLNAHFEFDYGNQPNFDRPRFKASDALVDKQKEMEEAAKKTDNVTQKEIDEVILRITLADAPTLKAILAEYDIDLP